MCGGPVKKATGGMIKSVAPKSVSKSAASAKQLPTPEIASKPRVQPLPPKDVVREAPRPTMEPKRQVQPTPPKDVRTIGGAPKNAKTMGGEPRRSDEGISAKQRLAGTAGDYAAPPEKAKTTGGAPKTPKAPEWMTNASTIGRAPEDVRTIGGEPKAPKGAGRELPRPTMAPKDDRTIGGAPKGAKTMGSVSPAAKKGVPVASNKPMIGFKTGGHVTKSAFKW